MKVIKILINEETPFAGEATYSFIFRGEKTREK